MPNNDLKLKLRIDASGNVKGVVSDVKNEIGQLDGKAKTATKSTDSLASSIQRVGHYAAGAFAVTAVLSFGKSALTAADHFHTLEQRVKTATSATNDYAHVSATLYSNAQSTNTALRTSVVLFQSLARMAPELNATNTEMLSLTKLLQQLGIIGGSSSEQMSNAMLQFSQAMAGGVMRAEEFNSIIENTPEVANRIAKGMEMTVGQLRLAVLEGTVLSKDVFSSLMKQSEEIGNQYDDMRLSMEMAGDAFSNSTNNAIASLDDALKLTDTLAMSIKGWSMLIDAVFEKKTALQKLDERMVELQESINSGQSVFGNSYTDILANQKELNGLIEKRNKLLNAPLTRGDVGLNLAKEHQDILNKEMDAELDAIDKQFAWIDKRNKETASFRRSVAKENAKEAEAEKKRLSEIAKLNQSYSGDIEQLRFEMVKYKMTNADVAAAEAMRAAYNKGYSRDQINAIGKQTKALFVLEQANKTALKEEQSAAKERNLIYENLYRRLDDGFAQVWYDVIDGSKTAFDFIQEAFKRSLAEMAHAATTKPIILSIMGGDSSADVAGGLSSVLGKNGAAAITSAMPWLAGGFAVEALTGGAISKALTGSGWKTSGQSISLSGGLDSVDAEQIIKKSKDPGAFRKTKWKTDTTDISGSLGATVSGLLREIDSIANQIGYDLANDFATNVTVSAGKDGDINAAMTQAVGQVTESAINSIGGLRQKLEAMQWQGESLTDTLKRLAAETEAEQQAAAKAADEKARIAQQEREARLQLVTDSEKALVAQYKVFESQSSSLKSTLLELADPQQALAYQREQELKAIDPLLRDQQKRLWALQDEAAAVETANQAHSAYQSTLSGVLGSLGSAFTNIKQFTAALVLGASATGASYASNLALAQSGDQAALSSITQSAQSYLADYKSQSATALDYKRVEAGVVADLNALPEQVSASQMIADEFKTAIKDQTDTLSFDYANSLKENFDALIPIVGETITKDEFASVYAGTASDSELTKIFESIAGSNGLIDATDLTTAAAADTALKTDDVSAKATSQLSELESITLATNSQVTAMGVLTDALGYNAQMQEKGLLQTAVDVAQKRFDNLDITGDQVADWESKKAAAEATDANALWKVNDKAHSEAMYAYRTYGASSTFFKEASYKQGIASDNWQNAVAADEAWKKVSDLTSTVYDYYDKAAQLQAAQDALAAFDGSHADGLAYVPFDGYVGQLHEGEAVLDADFMSGLRKYGINVNTPKNDNSELIAEIRQLRLEVTRLLANQNNISMGIASSNVSLTRYAKRASVVGYKVKVVE